MVTVSFRGMGANRPLTGFIYFWAKYVRAFNPDEHCKKSLIGPDNRAFGPKMALRPVEFSADTECKYIYLCAGAEAWVYKNNFHLALLPKEGGRAEKRMYTGVIVVVTGAIEVPIPPLPPGFRGLGPAYTTCRNFQFGIKYFPEAKPRQPELL